jgi:hypothetical protein
LVDPNHSPTLTVTGVTWRQPPTAALVTFNWFNEAQVVPTVRVNGGTPHVTAWPYPGGEGFTWRTLAVPISMSEVRPGTNTLTFSYSDLGGAVLANVNITLIAAAPVP